VPTLTPLSNAGMYRAVSDAGAYMMVYLLSVVSEYCFVIVARMMHGMVVSDKGFEEGWVEL